MTASLRIELHNAGESITLSPVTACGKVPQGRHPEIAFTGRDGPRLVSVWVPKPAADRQLKRLDLTYETAVGKTLKIGRSANSTDATKPFWDVTQPGVVMSRSGEHPVAAAASAPTNANGNGTVSAERREKLSATYKHVTQFVVESIVPLYPDKKLPPSEIRQIVKDIFDGVIRH